MLVKSKAAKILAKQISNAELKMFKQAGHAVSEEKWEKVKPVILNFLKRLLRLFRACDLFQLEFQQSLTVTINYRKTPCLPLEQNLGI